MPNDALRETTPSDKTLAALTAVVLLVHLLVGAGASTRLVAPLALAGLLCFQITAAVWFVFAQASWRFKAWAPLWGFAGAAAAVCGMGQWHRVAMVARSYPAIAMATLAPAALLRVATGWRLVRDGEDPGRPQIGIRTLLTWTFLFAAALALLQGPDGLATASQILGAAVAGSVVATWLLATVFLPMLTAKRRSIWPPILMHALGPLAVGALLGGIPSTITPYWIVAGAAVCGAWFLRECRYRLQ